MATKKRSEMHYYRFEVPAGAYVDVHARNERSARAELKRIVTKARDYPWRIDLEGTYNSLVWLDDDQPARHKLLDEGEVDDLT